MNAAENQANDGPKSGEVHLPSDFLANPYCPACRHQRSDGPPEIEQIKFPEKWQCHLCGSIFMWSSNSWVMLLNCSGAAARLHQISRGYTLPPLAVAQCADCGGTGKIRLFTSIQVCRRCAGKGTSNVNDISINKKLEQVDKP